MRLGAVAETPLEWLALRLGRVPTPLVDTHLAFAWARTVMVAVRVGVFEALSVGARTPEAVAGDLGSDTAAMRRLLHALVGMGYLRPGRKQDSVALAASSRRWLTRASPDEVIDKVLFSFDEWRMVEGYEAYVRHGRGVGMHGPAAAGAGAGATALGRAPIDGPSSERPPTMPAADGSIAAIAPETDADAWDRYQAGLHAVARRSVAEVARVTPVPSGSRQLLDLGGGHGAFAAGLLRRHAGLHARVLDLAPAVAAAEADAAHVDLGMRLRFEARDVLEGPLGDGDVDVVFASQLNHHFDDRANRRLAARVAAALRPGGVYVVQDLARPADPHEARRARLGALLDLYFGATSGGGTYAASEMAAWQRSAGLRPRRPRWMRTLPGLVQQVAIKPSA